MMTFQLINDRGEVVLAAESDATWNTIGTTRYTVGDMLMLGWHLTPQSRDKWPLMFTRSSGDMIYSWFNRAAHHYKLKYSGSPDEGLRDYHRPPGTFDPHNKPMRPVYTGEEFDPGLPPRNLHTRPVKSRVYILETTDGREVVRATLSPGRWHEMVEVTYTGDTSVLAWSESPAKPSWIYSFFRDLDLYGGLRLTGPDKDGEPYGRSLPPGWWEMSEDEE